ncbi:cytochrome C assembly family protein [Alkalicoccobacillus porphyridii]|uniref:Cytochrome C assembly protein n=1 Tax=Alkalicoccobacillus porphyridii TaxID=2597270 RepID=A0A553ZXT1_9BACI|nr:cytochrome c biogenesis protein CcsA [Alkalicoccobacillus porphyridii]TSB46261.1 cytochrome C assembly protein [Alkalicoccobacillus porphyridii]
MSWIYPLTVILYSFSVLGYFIDFLFNNRKVNVVAFWLLSIVWSLQTVFFVLRALEMGRIPILTPFEGLFFYAWSLVTISLILNLKFKVDFLILVINLVGFCMMTISLFKPHTEVPTHLASMLQSELLVLHISFILVSYTAFTLSFSFAILYVVQHQMLKKKKFSKRLQRFGAFPQLERFSFIAASIGVPLMLIGVIFGFIWAWVEYNTLPWSDIKTISSILTLIVYGAYLYQRVVNYKRGYQTILLNVGAFLVLLINYFLSGQYSSFHIWT